MIKQHRSDKMKLYTVIILCLALSIATVSAQGNSQSNKKEGDACTCRYGAKDGFDGVFLYFEAPDTSGRCTDGGNLVCVTEEDDGTFGKDFNGKCKSAQCFAPVEDVDGKITICHRTCSENNPWVRITIDSSAWVDGGHSCGHTTESCTGKDLSYWGDFQADYVLKVHGNRADVAARLNNDIDAIDSYWKHWEPACPSVRNGQCCFVDESSPYGYSCCGRAKVDPPMPADFDPTTSAPGPDTQPFITEAPSPFPMQQTTDTTEDPTNATEDPTNATEDPNSAPTDPTQLDETLAPFQEPPQCFARKLQDYSENWGIAVPQFRYQQSLSFLLDFEISDYITSETMISHTVMDATCTNSYTGAGLLSTRGLRLPIGNNRQKVGVALWIDADKIAADTEIFTDLDDGVTSAASVDFCVRFGLFTPPTAPGGAQEINWMEVVVKFDADLSDGFDIGTLNLEPLDRCEVEAQEAYEVEGYFCEDGAEATPIVDIPVLNQGQLAKVCVRPVERALDQGIRLRNIRDFKWKLVDRGLEQIAIKGSEPSSDGLTEYYCTPGFAICHFGSLLFASFFAVEGVVTGEGVADLQFGGQESRTSVSPKGVRRQLRDNNISEGRLLQTETVVGGSAEFTMEAKAAQSNGLFMFGSGSDDSTIKLSASFWIHSIIGVISMVVVTILL
jgi:hypothetical protein